MTEPKIQIKNLYKIFGDNAQKLLPLVRDEGMGKDELLDKHNHVLGVDNVSLDIWPKQIQVVMGLSGSGKSTLIRHINRLIDPTGGEVTIDGEDVLAMNETQLRELRRHKMSMVFQKFALLPHRTIGENVGYGLEVQGLKEDEIAERTQHWIDRVGLTGYESHYPGQLSGGMQQRVGLARGLATDADILLMDEAFSALDPLIRYDMQSILLELQNELHKTIVFITHDLDEALRLGDDIAILRDGAMVQQGDAQADRAEAGRRLHPRLHQGHQPRQGDPAARPGHAAARGRGEAGGADAAVVDGSGRRDAGDVGGAETDGVGRGQQRQPSRHRHAHRRDPGAARLSCRDPTRKGRAERTRPFFAPRGCHARLTQIKARGAVGGD